jgi:hypothetical protein
MKRTRQAKGQIAPNLPLVMGWGYAAGPLPNEVANLRHLFDVHGVSLCKNYSLAVGPLLSSPRHATAGKKASWCSECEGALGNRQWGRPTWRKQDEHTRIGVRFRHSDISDAILLSPGMRVKGVAIPWPMVLMHRDLWVVTYDSSFGCYVVIGHLPTWALKLLGMDIRSPYVRAQKPSKEVAYSD